MKRYTCPSCKTESIPLTDKYRAGQWRVIHCPHCNARLCAQPWVLMVGWMIYVWAAAWFGFWAWLEHTWLPLLYLIPVWLLLDFLNVTLMPLAVMRPKGQ
jgi:DNA-directed RNA polymerase subunit RPC12/RpoP